MTKYTSYQLITCVLCWLHYQFSTIFTNPKLFSVIFVQSVVLHPVFPRYNITSFNFFVCFPSSLFLQVFQSKTFYAVLIYSVHVLCYTNLITHDCALFCQFLCCCFRLCSSFPQHLLIHWHTVSSFHTLCLGLFLV